MEQCSQWPQADSLVKHLSTAAIFTLFPPHKHQSDVDLPLSVAVAVSVAVRDAYRCPQLEGAEQTRHTDKQDCQHPPLIGFTGRTLRQQSQQVSASNLIRFTLRIRNVVAGKCLCRHFGAHKMLSRFVGATISASTIRKTNFLVPEPAPQAKVGLCELINCQVNERCLSISLTHCLTLSLSLPLSLWLPCSLICATKRKHFSQLP